jgi:hypothetical protein
MDVPVNNGSSEKRDAVSGPSFGVFQGFDRRIKRVVQTLIQTNASVRSALGMTVPPELSTVDKIYATGGNSVPRNG